MVLKTQNVEGIDSNVVANGVMRELNDIDRMERMLGAELSSEDLFRIDSAILSSLRNTTDFSRDLLNKLETGKFETVAVKPPKSIDLELANIQHQTMADITLPLQNMFDEMADYVSEAFVK